MPWERPTSPGPGGGSGSGITSVNGQTGPAVNLTAADVGAVTQGEPWYSQLLTLTAYPPAEVHDPGMSKVGNTYSTSGGVLGGVWLAGTPPGAVHEVRFISPPDAGAITTIVIAYPNGVGAEYTYCAVGVLYTGALTWLTTPTVFWNGGGYSGIYALSDVLFGGAPKAFRWDHGTGVVWVQDQADVWYQATNQFTLATLPRTLVPTGAPVDVGLGLWQDGGVAPISVEVEFYAGLPQADLRPGGIATDQTGEAVRLPIPEGLYTNYPWAVSAQADSGATVNLPVGAIGQNSVKAQTYYQGQSAIGLTNLSSDGQMEYFLWGGRYILNPGTAAGQVLRMQPWPLGILQTWGTEAFSHDIWRTGTSSARYYPVPWQGGATAMATAVMVANAIRCVPLCFTSYKVVDVLAINVTASAAGGEVAAAIYADDGTGYPGTLVASMGTFNVAAIGVKVITGLALTFAPGSKYWVALWSNGAPTCRAQVLSNSLPVLGTDATLATAMGLGWSSASAYTPGVSTFPLAFPAGAAVITAVVPTPFILCTS